jgi:hypothetical protein
VAGAQMRQNPSPMVEHRRAHPRLTEAKPRGERFDLSLGTLYLPANPRGLLVFFHGGKWLPEVAAERNRLAAVSIQLGTGSGVYSAAFEQPRRLPALLEEAEAKAGRKFGQVTLGGWSAGCGAIRAILRDKSSYDRVQAVVCIDGMHTGYVDGVPGPLESKIDSEPLLVWRDLARDAIAGHKRFLLTHSEIFPGTFASTRRRTGCWGSWGCGRNPCCAGGRWGHSSSAATKPVASNCGAMRGIRRRTTSINCTRYRTICARCDDKGSSAKTSSER